MNKVLPEWLDEPAFYWDGYCVCPVEQELKKEVAFKKFMNQFNDLRMHNNSVTQRDCNDIHCANYITPQNINEECIF